jgi:fructosamine-3-kinase
VRSSDSHLDESHQADQATAMTSATFTKRNRSAFPDALTCEAQGLCMLAEHAAGSGIQIPAIISVDQNQMTMTTIKRGFWTAAGWRRLGRGLAHIHRRQFPRVGLAHDNYIGLNPQPNGLWKDWGEFFFEQRLSFQVSLIACPQIRTKFEKQLAQRKPQVIGWLNESTSQFSLLHGDLWAGNVLCDEEGQPWLIDPAVYIGDPEVDIAMTEMFGGFNGDFYDAYHQVRSVSADYQVKKTIYNLYHYLNHYTLFGDGYLADCNRGFEALRQL